MIKYVFRDGPLILRGKGSKETKADPQKIGEALAEIEARDGELSASSVVDTARDKANVLHRHFEWNDLDVAELYRLEQARDLIQLISKVDDDGKKQQAYCSVSIAGEGRSYHSVNVIKSSIELQKAVLKQAENDLAAFQRRYRQLSDICAMVKPAHDAVKVKRQKLETGVPA